MVYKSSFGRGFNSSILNSYVLSVLLCISISITLFVLSVLDAKSLKFFRFATISFCKPIFIAVGKPFQIFNSSLIYLREVKLHAMVGPSPKQDRATAARLRPRWRRAHELSASAPPQAERGRSGGAPALI